MAIQLNVSIIRTSDTEPLEIDAYTLSDANKTDIDSAGLSNTPILIADGIHQDGANGLDKHIKFSTLLYIGNPYIMPTVFSGFIVIGGNDNSNNALLSVEKFKFDDSAKMILNNTPEIRAAGSSSNGRDLVTFGGNQGSFDRWAFRVDADSASVDKGKRGLKNCTLNGRKAAVVNNGVDWVQGSRYHFTTPQTDNFEKYNLESNTDAVMTYTITTPITEAAMAGNKKEFVIMGGIEFFGGLNSDIHKVHYDDSVTGSVATNSMQTAGGKSNAIHYEGDVIHAMDDILQLVKLDDSAAVVRQNNSPTLNMDDAKLAQDANGDFIRATGFTSGLGVATTDIFKYKVDDSAAETIMTNQLSLATSGPAMGEAL